MKTIALALAIAATLTVPASAQQVRGIDGAIAHFNRSTDAPNDRIRPRSSRLLGFTRSTRGPRALSRAPRIGSTDLSARRSDLTGRQLLTRESNDWSTESRTERR
ncbi:MAG: hypothetical protein AAF366_01760 [Pseudomonadota bacterium]